MATKIYQLKIHLEKVSPMIWRRLLVKDTTSIAQFVTLHDKLESIKLCEVNTEIKKQMPHYFSCSLNEVIARRFCKKQQMQWSKRGAHLMLQPRTKVLNGDLVDCFKKWYPNLKIEQEDVKEAA